MNSTVALPFRDSGGRASIGMIDHQLCVVFSNTRGRYCLQRAPSSCFGTELSTPRVPPPAVPPQASGETDERVASFPEDELCPQHNAAAQTNSNSATTTHESLFATEFKLTNGLPLRDRSLRMQDHLEEHHAHRRENHVVGGEHFDPEAWIGLAGEDRCR